MVRAATRIQTAWREHKHWQHALSVLRRSGPLSPGGKPTAVAPLPPPRPPPRFRVLSFSESSRFHLFHRTRVRAGFLQRRAAGAGKGSTSG